MSMQTFKSSSVCSLVTGACIGAAVMYFFDPQAGRRRRALVRDQVTHATHVMRDAQQAKAKDLANRASGWWSSLMSPLRRHDESDEAVNARVRARLGRLVLDSDAVESSVRDGRLVLTGTIGRGELDRLLTELHHVRGVREIDNRLSEVTAAATPSRPEPSAVGYSGGDAG